MFIPLYIENITLFEFCQVVFKKILNFIFIGSMWGYYLMDNDNLTPYSSLEGLSDKGYKVKGFPEG